MFNKKFKCIALGMFMCLSIPALANSQTLSYEEMEKQGLLEDSDDRSVLSSEVVETEVFSAEDKAELDSAFEKSQEIEREKDALTADAMLNLTGDQDIYEKTISFEKSDRIDSILKMIEILESTNNMSEEDYELLTRYITKYGPYTESPIIISYICDNLKEERSIRASSYSTSDAVSYAHKYAESYNTPTYPNLNSLGGDCANFVSQCLSAGGMNQDDEWYITRLNTTYTKPTNSTQLDYSWDLADPSPWISASEFTDYWTNRADDTYDIKGNTFVDNPEDPFHESFYKGDPVQILEQVAWWYEGYHTIIITGYDSSNNDYLFSGHTDPRYDYSLQSVAKRYDSSSYKFRFFSVS